MPELTDDLLGDQLRSWADDLASTVDPWSLETGQFDTEQVDTALIAEGRFETGRVRTDDSLRTHRDLGIVVRLLGAAAVIVAVAAGGLYWASVGDRTADVTTGPVGTPAALDVSLQPAVRLQAAFDATLASDSWTIRSVLERLDGTIISPTDDPSRPLVPEANRTTRVSGELVSVEDQTRDGSRLTTVYLDFTSDQEYWLHEPGQWQSRSPISRSSWDPRSMLGEQGSDDRCVHSVDAHHVRIPMPVGDGSTCPTMTSQGDAALPYVTEYTFTEDGRLESIVQPRDEGGYPVAPPTGARMVQSFTDYDSTAEVVLPDPSVVQHIDTSDHGNWALDSSGYRTWEEPTCVAGSAVDCEPAG